MFIRCSFLLFLLFASILLCAQSRLYQINADTVRIFSSCDTTELIIENRTRHIQNGVLTNIGNGVTEFRRLYAKLSDSTYSLAGDTFSTAVARNIYNSNGALTADRHIDGNTKNVQFTNNASYLIANIARPVLLSRASVDSQLLSRIYDPVRSPFAGAVIRGTGCDATLELVSDTAGTCNAAFAIDFASLRPRRDSWLSQLPDPGGRSLMGRIQLQTSNAMADYAAMKFAIRSDTAFFQDGAYTLYSPGTGGGFMPNPLMTLNPSFRSPVNNFSTKMPFVQINGSFFAGYGRNWYYNSKNAQDIILGVDDVPGSREEFFNTRFSVYADSLPLKVFKLPPIKGTAFLSYTPGRTVSENNVAFEYKDSVYEDIRNYISKNGLITPSDVNLKENITPTVFDSEKLLGLTVKDFNYKADKEKKRVTGLIAQEVKTELPILVSGSEGHYGIDYIKMIPFLLKIVQEQHAEIITLKRQQIEGLPKLLLQLQKMQEELSKQQAVIKGLAGKN